MGILNDWIEDLPQQFHGKFYIESLVSAFSRQMEELHRVFKQLNTETDLESAIGKNLDMVGDIVTLTRKEAGILAGIGVTEPVISDWRYRQFLKYKVLKNTNNCTYYDIMQSIEILWKTDNIKYCEDPSRPATILIRLQTMDVDLGIDPAFGKTLAVKPAGVALIYTVGYIVIIDSSQFEQFYFSRLQIRISVPFWACRILDGTWLLDGSVMLDARRRYDLVLGLRLNQGNFHISEENRMASVRFESVKVKNDEMFRARVGFHSGIHFWDVRCFDGTWNLDGSELLDEERDKSGVGLTVHSEMDFSELETVENTAVSIKTRDHWFLTGVLSLDGIRNLNSIYRKETVE